MMTLQTHNLYGNILVVAPNGTSMYRCSSKRATWFVDRQLGGIVSDGQETFLQLNFQPKDYGSFNTPDLLLKQENKCVVCGSDKDLTKHYLIPFEFRKHFPQKVKSHTWWNLLLCCITCKSKYETHARKLRNDLAIKYSVPINGIKTEFTLIQSKLLEMSKLAFVILTFGNRMSEKVLLEKRTLLANYFQITESELTLHDLTFLYEFQYKHLFEKYTIASYGKMIVNNVTMHSTVQEFSEMWKKHFIDCMRPQFLPKHHQSVDIG